MMQQVQNLMSDFLTHRISSEDYVSEYMTFWEHVRDEQDAAIDAQGLRKSVNELNDKMYKGSISKEVYEQQWQELVQQVKGIRVPIGTEVDRILSHLFVEADAYEGDAELRDQYQIDEEQLRKEVQKAFDALFGHEIT